MVGLIQRASITIKAETNLNSWNYVYYCIDKFGEYHVFLSDYEVVIIKQTSSIFTKAYDLTNGGDVPLTNNSEYYVSSATGSYADPTIVNKNALHLKYNGLEWETYQPYFGLVDTEVIGNQSGVIHAWIFCRDYTMGKDFGRYITSISTNKPSGFPEIDFSQISIEDVQNKIDQALNSTTTLSTQANQIQTQATNAYVSYSNGSITLNQLQTTINNLANQLQNLNNSSSATLADKVAINNAITQTQLIQDAANKDQIIQEMEQDLTVSSSVSATITGKINQANQVFNNYSQGSTTQTEAVSQINQYITQLTQLITPQTPTADINAINSAINTINGIKDSVTTHSELSPDVSEEQVKSDQEEVEMLNELVSVMQDQTVENKMEDQEIAGKANTINNILDPVWENKFFTYLIGTCSVLIIACILLHVRYRML